MRKPRVNLGKTLGKQRTKMPQKISNKISKNTPYHLSCNLSIFSTFSRAFFASFIYTFFVFFDSALFARFCASLIRLFRFCLAVFGFGSVASLWRKILCFLVAVLAFGDFALALDKDATRLIQTYRTQGIEKTAALLEQYLQRKDFWASMLQDKDTDFGYFEGYEYLFVSNKSAPNLSLYKITNGNLRLIRQLSALVGKGKGDKRVQGDLTTPIGAYDFTGKLTGLPPYYGPLAYATDYPNNYDKALKRTGGGIWIHGLPLDGNREELNTRGCIAIDNAVLSDFGKMVDYKKAMLITYEGELAKPSKDDLATLLAALYQWREAWKKNNLNAYLAFYHKDFMRIDGSKLNAFKAQKKQVFAKQEQKDIILSNISVVPYPNDEKRVMFRVSFQQDYKAYKNGKISYSSNHYKILYVSYENGKMQILTER